MKNNIEVFVDEEIITLKNELERLEYRLEELAMQKAEIEAVIVAFNARYYAEVGELLEKLLRAKIQKSTTIANEDEADEVENLKKEYNGFRQSFECAKEEALPILNALTETELKMLYREACKLCNPDIIASDKRDEAEKVFKNLNEAYTSKNIKKVREIYNELKLKSCFASLSESVDDKELLKIAIATLSQKIAILEQDIKELLSNEIYRLIAEIKDMDVYFDKLKSDLEKELEEITKEASKDFTMPTISMFYGIIIRMYCAPSEHNPPHFHAYYGEHKAIIDINSCELADGYLPNKQLKIVVAWAELRKEELLADWTLAQNGELPYGIEPIK